MKKFLGLGLGVAAVFGLASCSNGVNEPNTPNGPANVTLELVKAPDFYAWSGSQVLGDTRATRGYADDGTGHMYYIHDNEVEVNLSLLDQHINEDGANKYDVEGLAAKLSVHVRNINNVEVTLPIPETYVIDSDDLLIFNSHEETGLLAKLAKSAHSATYTIAEGKQVTVTVTFASSTDGKNKGTVTVTTSGITEGVIEACRENYKDGLNFEVYIYLEANKEYTVSALKNGLNDSKVKFLDGNKPEYFINAFGSALDEETGEVVPNPNDCVVELDASVSGFTKVGERLTHTNGTSFNTIWSSLDADKVDHAHGGSYDPNKPVPPTAGN